MRKFDMQILGYINVFESKTNAKVVDAFFDNNGKLVFIVAEGDIGKAIGRQGAMIKRIGFMMKKAIRVIEFSDDVIRFVKNIILPLIPEKVELQDDIVTITAGSSEVKAMIIGREKSKIKEINEIIKK